MHRYRIVFKDNTVHDRWAAHAGGERPREIEIPGHWWSADFSQQFHFEDLILSEELRGLLSPEDKVRFGVAYKVYGDVTNGVGYFGTEGTNYGQEPLSEPATGELHGA